MLADALLDLSNRGDIVIDPFLGSGSTLIAADKIGHVCRGVDLDSLYVEVIMRRYAAATGNPAVLIETGEAFDALARVGQGTIVLNRPAGVGATTWNGSWPWSAKLTDLLTMLADCPKARSGASKTDASHGELPDGSNRRAFGARLAARIGFGANGEGEGRVCREGAVFRHRFGSDERHRPMAISSKSPPLHQEVGASRPGFPAPTIPRLLSALARKLMVCRVYSARTTGLGRRTRQ